jgi:L-lactate dehydrogenase complex protein LldF
MKPSSDRFVEHAAAARRDATLQAALGRLNRDARASRIEVRRRLPEFSELSDTAVEIKNHALARLDHYLEEFERNVTALGGKVHWCRDGEEACAAVLDICRARGATKVAKGKSMVTEEIALNDYLERHGVDPIETDLGEYILQLRGETPSHIVMPAIHLTRGGIADTFRAHHTDLEPNRPLDEARALTDEARGKLREPFLGAEIGITGANFLIAESGTAVIVTNEGNGDLVQSLPPVHVIVTGIEKVIPTAADAFTLLRVLARSATGQEFTSYTTFATAPRRPDDADGPEEFHVILLDNGRSEMLSGEFREALRCIRCGACQSVCPVYRSVGGHAYGWVYGGPIGSVLTPALIGHDKARDLPEASSFCGACEEICPVRIPLPALLRRWRERSYRAGLTPAHARWAIALWGRLARRPGFYRLVMGFGVGVLGAMAGRRGRFRRLPFAGGWTVSRDLPAPEGGTFMSQWRAR